LKNQLLILQSASPYLLLSVTACCGRNFVKTILLVQYAAESYISSIPVPDIVPFAQMGSKPFFRMFAALSNTFPVDSAVFFTPFAALSSLFLVLSAAFFIPLPVYSTAVFIPFYVLSAAFCTPCSIFLPILSRPSVSFLSAHRSLYRHKRKTSPSQRQRRTLSRSLQLCKA
jgi:hypothetical protein